MISRLRVVRAFVLLAGFFLMGFVLLAVIGVLDYLLVTRAAGARASSAGGAAVTASLVADRMPKPQQASWLTGASARNFFRPLVLAGLAGLVHLRLAGAGLATADPAPGRATARACPCPRSGHAAWTKLLTRPSPTHPTPRSFVLCWPPWHAGPSGSHGVRVRPGTASSRCGTGPDPEDGRARGGRRACRFGQQVRPCSRPVRSTVADHAARAGLPECPPL
jgi:hypothetical protein